MLVLAHTVATFLMRFVPVRVAHALVGWLTPVALVFARAYFERATANMRQVLGPNATPAEVRRLTRRAFCNYARYMVDLVRLPSIDPAELRHTVAVVGWEHVEEAYRVGKGVVFATGHIGSWDLAGAAFAARGKLLSAPVETLKPERWNERVQAIRNHVGIKAIPIETGVREMIAALRRHEGLAVLVDRPLVDEGVPVTFFGRETRVPAGAATLALRTGSPVVPAVLLREPGGIRYVAHIGPPILPSAGHSPAEVQAMTQRIMEWLEGAIRRHPDQWYMFRQMWPAGGAVGPWSAAGTP